MRLALAQELTTPEAVRRLAISNKTPSNWVVRAQHGQLTGLGETRPLVTELEAEVSVLKRELAEARTERDIFKKTYHILCQAQLPVHTDDDAVPPGTCNHPVPGSGDIPSGYHAWHPHCPLKDTQKNARWEVAIQTVHVRTYQTYGPEPLQVELRVQTASQLEFDASSDCAESWALLSTSSSLHDRLGFEVLTAGRGKPLGLNACHDTAERAVSHHHSIRVNHGRLAVSCRSQGSVHLRGHQPCNKRPDDDQLVEEYAGITTI